MSSRLGEISLQTKNRGESQASIGWNRYVLHEKSQLYYGRAGKGLWLEFVFVWKLKRALERGRDDRSVSGTPLADNPI